VLDLGSGPAIGIEPTDDVVGLAQHFPALLDQGQDLADKPCFIHLLLGWMLGNFSLLRDS
jgi:hypothetical protein